MKAYITYDDDRDVFELSTDTPTVWAGVDNADAVEVELPSEIIQRYLGVQSQWQNAQDSLEQVYDLRTGGITVGTD